MLMAPLFMIAQNWKDLKCPSKENEWMNEWISRLHEKCIQRSSQQQWERQNRHCQQCRGILPSIKQKKSSVKDYVLYGSSYPECNKTSHIHLLWGKLGLVVTSGGGDAWEETQREHPGCWWGSRSLSRWGCAASAVIQHAAHTVPLACSLEL